MVDIVGEGWRWGERREEWGRGGGYLEMFWFDFSFLQISERLLRIVHCDGHGWGGERERERNSGEREREIVERGGERNSGERERERRILLQPNKPIMMYQRTRSITLLHLPCYGLL